MYSPISFTTQSYQNGTESSYPKSSMIINVYSEATDIREAVEAKADESRKVRSYAIKAVTAAACVIFGLGYALILSRHPYMNHF